MIIKNVSGGAFVLSMIGKTLANNEQVEIADKYRQDEDIAAAITAGTLSVVSYSTDAASIVAQDEVSAAVAAAHTHANQAELDLVTDGDHDVSDGSAHSIVGANQTHATGNGADHADVATNSAHVAGNGADHADVATNSAHVAGDGSDHSVVAANAAHVAVNPGNPHGVTPTLVGYTPGNPADWAGTAPANVKQALDRIAAQLAIVGAAPIP